MRTWALATGVGLAACAADAPGSAPVASAPVATSVGTSARATKSERQRRIALLREREGALRSHFEPAERLPWLDVSGSDPYRISARPGSAPGFVGILRGSKALVSLNAELLELGRATLPEAPTALCLSGRAQALVASRYRSEIWRFDVTTRLRQLETWRVEAPGVLDLACGPAGVSYALTEEALLTLDERGRVLQRRAALTGGLRLLVRERYLLESSLFERSLRVLALNERAVPGRELGRIQHDGPLWAFDALLHGGHLLVALAGVEDRPLLRAHGEFENIDSYVWLYQLPLAEGGATSTARIQRVAELNVGEHGLVLPKALALRETTSGISLDVLGGGSGHWLRVRWASGLAAPAELELQPALPGASDAVFGPGERVRYASPLFDGWVQLDSAGSRLVRVDPERRPTPTQRLGEALFFTDLVAPENRSTGGHSRFSCETCHFEGGVDGRLHYTGRADVSVVTKPLFGLANNRPHFSRALNRDLSSVSHDEFRVAGAGSGNDPWFTLSTQRFSWLYELGINAGELPPLELRAALLEFLYAFTHAPNPRAQQRASFSELERQGASAFAQHCAGCHAPRLFSDDATSTVDPNDWARFVLSRQGPIVWARPDYAKTGILPYVHERGTRVPSLRRLALKPRYFTNGSSPTLSGVLERFRVGATGPLHAAAAGQGLVGLPVDTQRALLAFLRLL